MNNLYLTKTNINVVNFPFIITTTHLVINVAGLKKTTGWILDVCEFRFHQIHLRVSQLLCDRDLSTMQHCIAGSMTVFQAEATKNA